MQRDPSGKVTQSYNCLGSRILVSAVNCQPSLRNNLQRTLFPFSLGPIYWTDLGKRMLKPRVIDSLEDMRSDNGIWRHQDKTCMYYTISLGPIVHGSLIPIQSDDQLSSNLYFQSLISQVSLRKKWGPPLKKKKIIGGAKNIPKLNNIFHHLTKSWEMGEEKTLCLRKWNAWQT